MKKLMLCLIGAMLFLPNSSTAMKNQHSTDLTKKQVIIKTLQAREHFWNIMMGHNPKIKHSTCQTETVEYHHLPYMYMCSEFSTKEKMTQYLAPIFTKKAIKEGFEKYKIVSYKGKMIVPVGDGSNLLSWENSSFKLISKKGNIRTYEFTVPSLDGTGSIKRKITFIKENHKWKMNQLDAVM
ncbi:IseA DL-endopeptidase inhibitor family protein [Bacillus changyiensis]|uniref:IseA DL-endopeptidase inhibitor family protein n=1 Tax=Bacillus changyiensis TaxID=3004103 RepID=UPI0022E220F9|nr:IseA DL-endopeptidase inhibitor family protein [Bacillus changyiensis]MDA1475860.1 IseA DL-endopeptidase inhibitor family protein [Bacillus changyiensis]